MTHSDSIIIVNVIPLVNLSLRKDKNIVENFVLLRAVRDRLLENYLLCIRGLEFYSIHTITMSFYCQYLTTKNLPTHLKIVLKILDSFGLDKPCTPIS